MKTSFIQIFDTKDAAVKALGFMSNTYPTHKHELADASNQVQVWTNVGGAADAKTYGAPDPKVIYVVLSMAPK